MGRISRDGEIYENISRLSTKSQQRVYPFDYLWKQQLINGLCDY